MTASKVAISMEPELVAALDRLVAEQVYSSRSQAIQSAVKEKLARLHRSRLAEQCAKLDAAVEQTLAEEGMSEDAAQWPEY